MSHQVNITIGQDPGALEQPNVISGFEGMSASQVEYIRGVVQDECMQVIRWAPAELMRIFQKDISIPLYNRNENEGFQASCLFKNAVTLHLNARKTMEGTFLTPIGYRSPELRGMIVNAEDIDSNIDLFRQSVGHECLHILSMSAVHVHLMAQWEAFVARIEKAHYPERKGLVIARPWDGNTLESTTGFSAPDFARIEYGKTAREAMYLSAYMDIDALTEQDVWGIWTALTLQTKATNLLPSLQSVNQTIASVAGDRGKEVLEKPTFRPMLPGLHYTKFPTKDGGARVYSFDAEWQEDYGTPAITGERKEIWLRCSGKKTGPHNQVFFDTNNQEITTLEERVIFEKVQDLSYEYVVQKLRRTPDSDALVSGLGNRMDIHVNGLSPIILEKTPSHATPTLQQETQPEATQDLAEIALQKSIQGILLTPQENSALQRKYGFRVE